MRQGDLIDELVGVLWLPPAIRPGLHCGSDEDIKRAEELRDFPRPSGRGSIAA